MGEKKITKFDIQNIDKIRFQIGYRKSQLVIIMGPYKPLCIIDSDNYDYITSIKYIDFTDKTISYY